MLPQDGVCDESRDGVPQMSLNTAVMFGKATDEWATPQELFDALDREFDFDLDAAASLANRKCGLYFTQADNALSRGWAQPCGNAELIDPATVWLNPPYSRCRDFIAKAAQEARKGCTVVALVPSRTDTRWWHEHVWDAEQHQPRAGVEIRFIKGRLKFGNSENSAPFPSVVIIFRPV